MRVAIAQLNSRVGDYAYNCELICKAIQKARSAGAALVLFPEDVLSGVAFRDLARYKRFFAQAAHSLAQIASHCVGITALVGVPLEEREGLSRVVAVLREGKVAAYLKDSCWIGAATGGSLGAPPEAPFPVVEIEGKRVGVVCGDALLREEQVGVWEHDPHHMPDVASLDLLVNMVSLPFSVAQWQRQGSLLTKLVSLLKVPLVQVNHVGGVAELLYPGASMLLGKEGEIQCLASFEEEVAVFDLREGAVFARNEGEDSPSQREGAEPALIHDALVMGIRDYMKKTGFKKAVLGLSGGIDSAVTMVLAAKALGAENVLGVLLPSPFSSDHSVQDARALAENLGSPYHLIPVNALYETFLQQLSPYFEGKPFDVTEENIQARLRGVVLMALSNKFGYMLLNTSNKSEAAVGYGTLYGDMCGGLSVLGDVYKTQVFALARYMNRYEEVIPWNTITKPPSAELRPGQKDSDSLPDYDVLDEVLLYYLEKRKGLEEIVALGFEEEMVRRVLRLVAMNEYKRAQAPPILRVTEMAFGSEWRMPLVAKHPEIR
ncbi:MAG: NAD+ synthase [Bacteroidetes bacterium]|nr:MAG: NAD+ synthase [Bacteroidota bacterium]PIE88504.1 MAG: NAD+ synthase [Bacteroidota bacterium]